MKRLTVILLIILVIVACIAYNVYKEEQKRRAIPDLPDSVKLLMGPALAAAANQVAADNLAKAQKTTDPKKQKKLLIQAKSAANKSALAVKRTGNLVVKAVKKINPAAAKGKDGTVAVVKGIENKAIKDAQVAKKEAASVKVKTDPQAAAGNIAALINANKGAITQTGTALTVATQIPPATVSSFGNVVDTAKNVAGKVDSIMNDPRVQKAQEAAAAAQTAIKAAKIAKNFSKMKNPKAAIMNLILSQPKIRSLYYKIFKPAAVADFIADNPNLLITAFSMLMSPMTLPATAPAFLVQVAAALVIFLIQRNLKKIKEGLVKGVKAIGKGAKIIGKGLKKFGRGAKKFFKKF